MNHDSRISKWLSRAGPWAFLFAVIAVLGLVGCSKSISEQAEESDANGYICTKCGQKFFTKRDVFAEQCPRCKKIEIVEVYGFVCPQDQHVTLVGRGPNSVACEKCNGSVSAVKMPREKELRAWGAEAKTKSEVSLP
jgi:uncharacterized OB-fold protein